MMRPVAPVCDDTGGGEEPLCGEVLATHVRLRHTAGGKEGCDMRRFSPLLFAVLLAACDDWPNIEAPPAADDRSVKYTPFTTPDAFATPVVELDENAADTEATVAARVASLEARAARLRAREF